VVGALTFVPADMKIPPRKVVVGSPAKVVRDVTDDMLSWKTEGTRLYQSLPSLLHASLVACEPLRRVEDRQMAGDPAGDGQYRTWHQTRES
jgi:hypothetical protein